MECLQDVERTQGKELDRLVRIIEGRLRRIKDPTVDLVQEAIRREVSLIEEQERHESPLEEEAILEEQEAQDAARRTTRLPNGWPAESKPKSTETMTAGQSESKNVAGGGDAGDLAQVTIRICPSLARGQIHFGIGSCGLYTQLNETSV